MADSPSTVSDRSEDSGLLENEFCTPGVSNVEGCLQYLHQVGSSFHHWGIYSSEGFMVIIRPPQVFYSHIYYYTSVLEKQCTTFSLFPVDP